MANLDGAAGARHGERDDGDVVGSGGGRAESKLARAVAELHRLAVARTGSRDLGGEAVQRTRVAGLVAEPILAGHPAHAGFTRGPVQHQLPGVHPALRRFHRAGDARHWERPHRRRRFGEYHRNFHGASLLHAVRELVRPVAHVGDRTRGRVLTRHPGLYE